MHKSISELSALGISIPRKKFSDKYNNHGLLGTGTFGNVYKVEKISTGEIYVAKVTKISQMTLS